MTPGEAQLLTAPLPAAAAKVVVVAAVAVVLTGPLLLHDMAEEATRPPRLATITDITRLPAAYHAAALRHRLLQDLTAILLALLPHTGIKCRRRMHMCLHKQLFHNEANVFVRSFIDSLNGHSGFLSFSSSAV